MIIATLIVAFTRKKGILIIMHFLLFLFYETKRRAN